LGEGKTLSPFYLDKHKRLLKLLREFRDNEEGYEVVLAEFEKVFEFGGGKLKV
jgi:hypothetical protein